MTTGNDAPWLTASRVQFTDAALPWQEAIRLVAQPLIDDGSVTPAYPDAVIETAEKMGPYFDLGKGVAMPHARPEAGVNKIGLSFLRTTTPVLLLDQAKHPIELFIMLAATDSSTHLTVMRHLARVLTDNARLEALKAATTTDQVLAILADPTTT